MVQNVVYMYTSVLIYSCTRKIVVVGASISLVPRPSAGGGGGGGGGEWPGTHCSRMHQISRHSGNSVALAYTFRV